MPGPPHVRTWKNKLRFKPQPVLHAAPPAVVPQHTWRLMDGASGRPGVGSSGTQPPASPSGAGIGAYIAGCPFGVSQGGLWFQGYWWYAPAGGDTGAQKFALWETYAGGPSAGYLIPGSVVTSGTLTAGQWNFVPLSTPLLLTPYAQNATTGSASYVAATGWTVVNGFPDTANQFGAGNPYAAGITNGPLFTFGASVNSGITPNSIPVMPFATGNNDPSFVMPQTNNANDNLWLDVQVSDIAPAGGSFRAFPNLPSAFAGAAGQTLSYTLGFQFSVSQSCALAKIWHCSVPSSTVLPSRCAVWDVLSQTVVAGTDNTSPSWKKPDGTAASAGAGWVYCDYSGAGVTLSAGVQYKAATFASSGGAQWFAASTGFWGAGQFYPSGITAGPLVIPNAASSSPGQSSWNLGTTWTYPATTSAADETDWIDVEVTPAVAGAFTGSAALVVTSALTAAGINAASSGASLAVTATAAAAGSAGGAASLTATAALAAAGTVSGGGAALAVTAATTAAGTAGGTAALTASAALAAAGNKAASTGASAALTATLTAAGSVTSGLSSGAVLAATATLAATGNKAATSGAALTVAAGLAAAGNKAASTGASLAVTASMAAAGNKAASASATAAITATLTAAGRTQGPVTYGTVTAGQMTIARAEQGQQALAHAEQGQQATAHAEGGQW